MKIALLKYNYPRFKQANIGDCVQSLAVAQHLPRVDLYIDRDRLAEYDGKDCAVVMNGWFSHNPASWPPSPRIHPIFHGFHMTQKAAEAYRHHIDYFKAHEPIGCRDRGTRKILQDWGIETYLSLCSTLTFPFREAEPDQDLTVLIDVPAKGLPRWIRQGSVTSPHELAPLSPETQYTYTRELLQFYRDRASRIVTSRIHAAMPAISMGIPVLYIGPKTYRTQILQDAGLPDAYVWKEKSLSTALRKQRITPGQFFRNGDTERKAQLLAPLRARLTDLGLV